MFGPTGSGKSKQAEELAKLTGWEHISTGELLRRSGSEEVQDMLKRGVLAPSEMVCGLVERAVSSLDPVKGIILDGFPRRMDEKAWLDQNVGTFGRRLKAVILIDISREESEKRLAHRHRNDDARVATEQKWDDWKKEMIPVVDQYQKEGLVRMVNGQGTPEEVFERVKEAAGV
jgi:adenylate kinase